MATAFVGLGSNLSDPLQQLNRASLAMAALPHTQLQALSPLLRSKPLDDMPQPDYLNAVAQLHTRLTPQQLLQSLHEIEAAQGRERTQRWAARTLDLDLLLYDELQLNEPGLQLPHYAMCDRAFVILPLLKLAPDLILPDGRALALVAQQFSDEELEWLSL